MRDSPQIVELLQQLGRGGLCRPLRWLPRQASPIEHSVERSVEHSVKCSIEHSIEHVTARRLLR